MTNLKKLLSILLVLSVVSCATPPPNIEVCVHRTQDASCTWTLEGENRRISLNEASKPGRFSMSYTHFGELKKYILESCERAPNCKNEKAIIQNFFDDLYGGEE